MAKKLTFSILIVVTPFLFQIRPPHVGSAPISFQNARSASGNRVLILKHPVPCRDSHFYFSSALFRIGIAVSIFRWVFPALGHPFLFFVRPFPRRDSHFYFSIRGQRYENSCNIVSLRPINAQKFNIFVYNRPFSEEFV